jgi:hypothetical protein
MVAEAKLAATRRIENYENQQPPARSAPVYDRSSVRSGRFSGEAMVDKFLYIDNYF